MAEKKSKKLAISGMFIAIGVAFGNLIYIPVGVSKCFPVQHAINVLSSIVLGPLYSVGIAFSISFLRNILGTGSLLAFPGSMIGAFLAGVLYRYTKNKYISAVGEVFGTGILGGLFAFPIAKYIMGNEVGAFFFIYPFILSSIGGSILSLVILKIMEKNKEFQVEAK